MLEPPDTVPVRPDLLAAYHPDGYDEAVGADGEVQPEYGWMFRALSRMGNRGLAAAESALHTEQRARGVTFRVGDGAPDRLFPLDLVPRIVTADDWAGLSAGLTQRVRALEAFLRDVYGPRQIIADGVIPASVVDDAPGLEQAGHAHARRRRAHRGGGHRPRARPGRPLARAGGQPAGALRHRVRHHVPAAHPQRDARPGAPGGRRRAGGGGGAAAQRAALGERPGPAGPRRGRPAVGGPGRLRLLRARAARRPDGRAGGDAARPAGDRRRRVPRRGGRHGASCPRCTGASTSARCSPRRAPTCARSGARSATRRPAGGSRWSTRWATGWPTTRSSTPTSPR